jgi:hypothetical protein
MSLKKIVFHAIPPSAAHRGSESKTGQYRNCGLRDAVHSQVSCQYVPSGNGSLMTVPASPNTGIAKAATSTPARPKTSCAEDKTRNGQSDRHGLFRASLNQRQNSIALTRSCSTCGRKRGSSSRFKESLLFGEKLRGQQVFAMKRLFVFVNSLSG